jgi:hypothetical protein
MPDDPSLMSIEDPYPGDPPAPEPEPVDAEEPEPEGAVEVAPGRRMVDVSVVAAERKRTREATEKRVRDEMAPLQEKAARADALQQALDTVKPYIEQLRNQPQPQKPAPDPVSQVSDAEAEQEARELQLYTKDSTLDIATAKRVIARRRTEAAQTASQAARDAIAPYVQDNAQQRQREQFAAMVNELGADDILTQEELARQFVQLGPELSQDPRVARVALERAIGQAYLQRRGRRAAAPQREPVLSESPGGRVTNDVTLSDRGRKMGLTQQDLKTADKSFTPGGVSVIGEW